MTESIRMKEANRSEEHEITDEIVKTIFYSIKNQWDQRMQNYY